MLDKLLKVSGTVALYGCTSLFLASLMLGAYLTYAWRIDGVRWTQLVALAQGHDIFGLNEKVEQRIAEMSFEQVLEIRAKRLREIESDQLIGNQPPATQDGDEKHLNALLKEIRDSRAAFDKYVKDYLDSTKETGIAEQTRLIEEAKPEQAKDIILGLIKDHGAVERVLTMLLRMEDQRRGEILYRMRNEEELKELCNLLQRIGNGEPLAKVIEDARDKSQ